MGIFFYYVNMGIGMLHDVFMYLFNFIIYALKFLFDDDLFLGCFYVVENLFLLLIVAYMWSSC